MFLQGFLWLAAIALATVSAKSSTGDRVLVVVEPERQDNYSLFFQGLRDSGYDLTFRAPKATEPSLVEFDRPSFSHVVMLALVTKNFAKDLSPQAFVDILSRDVNLLVALPQKQTPLSTLAAEFSLILPPPNSHLISYFPERDEVPTVVPIVPPKEHPILTNAKNPIWFTGVPHALGNSPFIVPILHAPPQSFAGELAGSADALVDAAEKGGEGLWAGSQLGVVTGYQALNNARATFVGGEVFSDDFFQKEINPGTTSGNSQFVKDIVAWTLQESLVFRIDRVEHHHVNATTPSDKYTVNDNIVFSAYISKYDPQASKWVPYSGIHDLQLEFTMLDPHIRTALLPVPGYAGKYSVTFRVPDRHGVFKFVINHRRKGMTYLQSSTTVPVVPPRHDGYPRFLSAAWPYYIGSISTSVGFLVFSAYWVAGEIWEAKKGKRE